MKTSCEDYVIRVHDNPLEIDAAAWDSLLDAQSAPTPFMRLAYLQALHRSDSAVPDTGWQPLFITVWQGDAMVAACPAYLKQHSYGEYVFDWAWADAYARNGLSYYPKLLVAVPFTPVQGSRLLARDAAARGALIQALGDLSERLQLSSAHVLFATATERHALAAAGWLMRSQVQFHWQRSETTPATFEAHLAQLKRDKRKKVQQEQRRVRDAGIGFEVRQGSAISATDWDFFYRCYQATYRAHRSTPYLHRSFFAEVAERLSAHWLMFTALRDGAPLAASLVALDPDRRSAYGRYWGCIEPVDCLHFDACYHQPLAWCLENGYQRFEGGAQGEHKMARGLLPNPTGSAHWLADARFQSAVADFLDREGQAMSAYVSELETHQPFKTSP